jgi:hypothetical protein
MTDSQLVVVAFIVLVSILAWLGIFVVSLFLWDSIKKQFNKIKGVICRLSH